MSQYLDLFIGGLFAAVSIPKYHVNTYERNPFFRSIKVDYIEDVMVNGIKTRHFENLPEVFNLTLPQNLCYCTNVRRTLKVYFNLTF